eukprot:365465-Chlamydomonas_euryale.AAC.1
MTPSSRAAWTASWNSPTLPAALATAAYLSTAATTSPAVTTACAISAGMKKASAAPAVTMSASTRTATYATFFRIQSMLTDCLNDLFGDGVMRAMSFSEVNYLSFLEVNCLSMTSEDCQTTTYFVCKLWSTKQYCCGGSAQLLLATDLQLQGMKMHA